MATTEEIGIDIWKKFLTMYDDMTTSDLQGCIAVEAARRGLQGNETQHSRKAALHQPDLWPKKDTQRYPETR